MKSHLDELQEKTDECTAFVLDAKEVRWISDKLNLPLRAPKTYWSILNHFLNNRKIPAIPRLVVNSDVTTNFSEKADLFNKFFADQNNCTPKYHHFNLKQIRGCVIEVLMKMAYLLSSVSLITTNLMDDIICRLE